MRLLRITSWTWICCALSFLSACTTTDRKPPASMEDRRETPPPPSPSLSETKKMRGLASWYGRAPGKRKRARKLLTANGEVFDRNQLTAAHRTWPFGSRVLVRNLGSGKEVVVRINDRGPFTKKRIIDLSYGAARALGIVKSGVAPVEIQLIHP